MQRIGLFDSIHAFQCILNDLLEGIELLNSVQCTMKICIEYSVGEYWSDFSPLHWHNMPAYLHFYYAAIIDGALTNTQYLQYGYLVNSMHLGAIFTCRTFLYTSNFQRPKEILHILGIWKYKKASYAALKQN